MFQISAMIDGVKTMKSNTLKIIIETQDVDTFTKEELAELFELNNKQIQVAFKENTIKVEEVDDYKPVESNDKTPGQRLRNALYVLWKEKGENCSSDEFYRKSMEWYIDLIKNRIEETKL